MTIAEAALNAHRIRMGRLTQPKIGTWIADVWTDDEIPASELETPLTISVGNLSFKGARIRGEAWQGGSRVRVVGGAGGWRSVLPARWYTSDAGVRPSVVAADAANECGETISEGVASDAPLGAWYARSQWSASRTLYQLGCPWRILDDGSTSLRAWPAGRISSLFDVVAYDSARCIVEAATDYPADWRPAKVLSNLRLPSGDFTISDVVHTFEPGKYRVQAWCIR